MKWFGPAVKLEQFDDGDRLRFRATSERRLTSLMIPIFAGVALLVYAWRYDASWLVLLGAIALIGFPIWRWFEVRITELRVTELELVAEGDLGDATGMVWLPWSEVSGLQYHLGRGRGIHGKAESNGLYALKGIADRVCLMPDVNEAQTGQIIHVIYNRFPYVAMVKASETPFPLGLNRDGDD